MPLPLPEIDDREYEELFREVLARIPVHNPEWTNHNDADPGITLLQLFSFMTENLLYRGRRIPERNRRAFLNLLGVEPHLATAAEGVVAFEHLRGRLEAITLERDLDLLAGSIPFRTRNGLAVLPVEGRAYVKAVAELEGDELEDVQAEYDLAYASFLHDAVVPLYYQARPVTWPGAGGDPLDLGTTADGTLWLALLARSADEVTATRAAIANQVLTVGVVPESSDEETRARAGETGIAARAPSLGFSRPAVERPLPEDVDERVAAYVPITATGETDTSAEPGVVQLELPGKDRLGMWDLDPNEAGVGDFPPALEGDDAERLVTWLRIRPAAPAEGGGDAPAQAEVRLGWVGVNAAMIEQRSQVVGEPLGRGDGRADQRAQLANTPVLTGSVTLTVAGVAWRQVSDLAVVGPELPTGTGRATHGRRAPGDGRAAAAGDRDRDHALAFTLDRETGEIVFGDGIHGARPPDGALIEATYDHGGGRAGRVAAEAVTKGPSLPSGLKVANPVATWGGTEPETVAQAERRIPAFVRHRDRLVTTSDFAEVARRTPGVDVGRVEVLPLVHPDLPDVRLPGLVTVLVVPQHDPVDPESPSPDRHFLDTVCRYLTPRRLITTELRVHGPRYVGIWLSVGIDVVAGRDVAPVREAVRRALRRHYSPLEGGTAEEGWPLSTSVERLEAWAVAARVDGVAKVYGVELTDASGTPKDRVELSGLQLPRLVALAVQQGEPRAVADLRGGDTGRPPGDGAPTPLPIPITPPEC